MAKPTTHRVNTTLPFALAALVGALLIGIGIAWPYVADPTDNWSQQQAKELREASLAWHAAVHQHAHAEREEHDTEHDADFKAVRQRYQNIRQEFDEARSSEENFAYWLTLSGGVLLGAALLGGLLLRPANGK